MSENSMENQSVAKVLLDIQAKVTSIQEQNIELRLENKLLRDRIRTLEVRLVTTEDTLINLSLQTLDKQTHKASALFPKLPPELRRMIWAFARQRPRVIKRFRAKVNDVYILYSTAKVPSLLHACQESRRVARSWYELSLHHREAFLENYSARVYFDFSNDFLYVPFTHWEDEDLPTRSIAIPKDIYHVERKIIKKVIQEVPKFSEQYAKLSIFFPGAVQAILVGTEEGMFQGAAEQSRFIVTADAFPWQKGRTLDEIYHQATKVKGRESWDWNLISIQRARFCTGGLEM